MNYSGLVKTIFLYLVRWIKTHPSLGYCPAVSDLNRNKHTYSFFKFLGLQITMELDLSFQDLIYVKLKNIFNKSKIWYKPNKIKSQNLYINKIKKLIRGNIINIRLNKNTKQNSLKVKNDYGSMTKK